MSEWASEQTSEWLCDCVTVWLCDCVTVWLCDCVTVWLCDCVTVWASERVSEWASERASEWVGGTHVFMVVVGQSVDGTGPQDDVWVGVIDVRQEVTEGRVKDGIAEGVDV